MNVPDRIAAIKVPVRDASRSPYRRRPVETTGLLLASLIVGLGLLLVYQAKSQGRNIDDYVSFVEINQGLEKKQLLNINTSPKSDQILPFLLSIPDEADRQFAAKEIEKFLNNGEFLSVDALSGIRVSEEDIKKQRMDPKSYRRRLEEAKQSSSRTGEGNSAKGIESSERLRQVKVSLLPQLTQLRPMLVVRTPSQFRNRLLSYSVISFFAFYLIHLVWRRRGFRGDEIILPTLHLLTGLGLIMAVTLFDPVRDKMFFPEFAQGIIAGCAVMLVVSFIDFQHSGLRKLSFIPLILSFLLSLLLIFLGWAPAGSNAKVNLTIASITFQPVEAITRLLVFFLAGYFAANWEFLREMKEERARLAGPFRRLGLPRLSYFAPVIIGMILALLFFLKQQDLGPALVMYCSFLVLYGVARGRSGLMIVGLAMLIAAFAVSYQLKTPATIGPRVDMWLSPWDNNSKGGDQVARSQWALASGAISGVGLGLSDAGEPGTLPAGHTDLILSAIGEELGFVGILAVFLLFAILIYRGLLIAINAPGTYSFFLVLGLTVTAVLQIILISGGVLGLLPLSGVVTPFLSVGRTAMLMNFLAFGILLAVSAHSAPDKRNEAFLPAVKVFTRVAAVLVIAVLIKAAYVQVFRSDHFLIATSKAMQADGFSRDQNNPRILLMARTLPKGSIYDRNGIPLATSSWAEIEQHRRDYETLSVRVDELKRRDQGRMYPFGAEAFYLLGDDNTDFNWAAPNTFYIERDSRMRLQGFDKYEELIPLLRYRYQPDHESVQLLRNRARDVRTSIDIALQLRVAQMLRNQLSESGVDKGAVVVLDAQTGDLLASVSYPVPGIASAREDLIDRARFGLRPPGSTFKLVTAMAALSNHPELMTKTFECTRLSGGFVGKDMGRRWGSIHDDGKDKSAHGRVAMQKAIAVSCNAFFAQLGVEVGAEKLLSTARVFERVKRDSANYDELRAFLPKASFGQHVLATPFEMALVAATIANDGKMPFGRWITDDSNQRVQASRDILGRTEASFLAQAMRSVVTDGTAWQLRAISPPLAGKTGTAQVQDEDPHSWFIGFAPYNHESTGRRIAFSIIIEHGKYGKDAAVPLAGRLVTELRERKLIQ